MKKRWKKLWKRIRELSPLSAAVLIFAATVSGYALSEPVLGEVVWPEKPIIEVVKAADKKDDDGKAESAETETESEPETETEQVAGDYEDGTYKGSGKGYGGTTSVEVIVKDKQITVINILSHQDTESYFAIAKERIIDSILQRQTWEVDVVSGATYSSRGIKEAVCNALTGETAKSTLPEQPKPKESLKNEEFKEQEWKDGTYEGSAAGFGGTITVQVTIKNGKIKSITVLNHSGETPSYYAKAKAIIDRIIKKQTPNVDTVSGATYSSGGIREAVKKALNKAAGKNTEETDKEKDKDKETEKDKEKDKDKDKDKKKEESEPEAPDGKPADGTYEASASCEQERRFSYQVNIKAIFKKGVLKKLSMTTTDTGRNRSYIREAWSVLKAAIMADPTGNVDVVSGATYTSKAIRTAYKAAYRKAVIAGGGTVEEETTEEKPTRKPNPPRESDEGESEESEEEEGKESDEGENEESEESGSEESGEDGSEESGESGSEESGESGSEESGESGSEESGEESGEGGSKESGESGSKESGEGGSESSSEESSEETKPAGPKDGSYSVTARVDPNETKKSSQKGYFLGYTISGTVKFKNGVLNSISNIRVVYSSDIDEEYEDDVYYTNKAASGMAGKLKSANSADVDTVSGATCSSKAIIRLYQAAYQKAMSE